MITNAFELLLAEFNALTATLLARKLTPAEDARLMAIEAEIELMTIEA